MTPGKQVQLLQGQTSLAKKVFDHVPIQDWYTLHQVTSALHRTSMMRINVNVLQGCLAALSDAGLIRCRDGKYQRTPISAGTITRGVLKMKPSNDQPDTEAPIETTTQTPEETTMAQQKAATPKSASPIELCGVIAEKLRGIAVDVENLGLALEESQQADKEQLQQFAQLKTLLGSLKA